MAPVRPLFSAADSVGSELLDFNKVWTTFVANKKFDFAFADPLRKWVQEGGLPKHGPILKTGHAVSNVRRHGTDQF